MAGKRHVEQPPVLEPAYFDAEGNRTEDPAQAVRGEVVERDPKAGRTRRTWFLVKEVEIKWLPVSESAFLLWGPARPGVDLGADRPCVRPDLAAAHDLARGP